FPLSQPVATLNAQDFEFDVPLPARPAGARRAIWRVVTYPAPGGTAARLKVQRRFIPDPHLHVIVRLAHRVRGVMPRGCAGALWAGWRPDETPLAHVTVPVDSLVVNNALQPAVPTVPRTCSDPNDTPCNTDSDCPMGESCFGEGPVKSWGMQAGVNGQGQGFPGPSAVDAGGRVAP